ncbi:MAG: radical SAM peptide maturase [Prolixibacteraceae bacterium]|jgi:uncharacterized protein|nr:radical SAM peptide maturase [Prolixibacteraceae bacterium]
MVEEFIKIDAEVIKQNLIDLKQLVFEVTDDCNLKCKYCGYGEFYQGYDKRERNKFPLEKAMLLLDYLVELWNEHIGDSFNQPFTLSFYGGEPLMNMEFIKGIVDYIENLENAGKKIHFSLTTNAMLLKRHMEYLVEKEFRLLISLDGDEKGHSYRVDLNGQNSHKRVMNNVTHLQEKHPEYFKKNVYFNTVLHNNNSVEGAFNYIQTHFGKDTTISPLNNTGIYPENLDSFWKTYQNINDSMKLAKDQSQLESKMFIKSPRTKQLALYFYENSGNIFNSYNDLLANQKKMITTPTGTCTPFAKKIFVSVNGKILPCENVDHKYAYGQIHWDRIDWDFQLIADKFNRLVFKYFKQCSNCSINMSCTQCILQLDDLDKKFTKCINYKSHREQEKYKEIQLGYLQEHPELYRKILSEAAINY